MPVAHAICTPEGLLMRNLLIQLAVLLILVAPAESLAKRPAEVIWKAAQTAPETAEEDQAHAEGRAIDINEVNKLPVSMALDANAPADKREEARRVLKSMEDRIRSDIHVKVFVGPVGGFYRDSKDRTKLREATTAEQKAHWDHIHIEVFD